MHDVGTTVLDLGPLRSLGRHADSEVLLTVPQTIDSVIEMPVIEFVSQEANDGGTLVDAGAHAGFYSILLAHKFKSVLAFEPSELQRGLLVQNIERNKVGNCIVRAEALGVERSTARLHVMGRSGGSNSLLPPGPDSPPMESYDVVVMPLDELELSDVAVLKVDVEGWELEVLMGAARTIDRCRPLIVAEVWNHPEARQKVSAWLSSHRYSFIFPFDAFPELSICQPL